MQSSEHIDLRRVEDHHWFYRGKREVAIHWLRRLHGNHAFDRTRAHMLDIGCGSGAMMTAAEPMEFIAGLEVSPVALQNLRPEVRGKTLAASSLEIPFKPHSFHCITCFDVIEHIEDDKAALKEIHKVLKPGGLLLINVPAYSWLWSDWDVALGHHRRYTRAQLHTILQESDYRVIHSSYENFIGLLPAMVIRMLRKVLGAEFLKVENKIPASWINTLLRKCYVWPSHGLSRLLGCGLSVWAVAERKE